MPRRLPRLYYVENNPGAGVEYGTDGPETQADDLAVGWRFFVGRHSAVESAMPPTIVISGEASKEYIEAVLRRNNWNVTRAAELLDVQRTHLHQRVAALGIVRPVSARTED